jgi:AraC-like DNA-binding protein
MKKNLCKFTSGLPGSTLSVYQYIRETEWAIMHENYRMLYHRMLLIMQGEGIFSFDSVPVPFRSGDLLFAFENEIVCVLEGKDVQYMYIDFHGSRADELLRRFGISPAFRCFSGYDGLIPMWEESLTRASEQTIDLAAESILLYTLSRMQREKSGDRALIDRVITMTEEGFANSELSIATIAQELSYNPKYLSHLFKKKMGINYSAYLRSVRIKYAISLFDHGIDSIKNAAWLSGFNDPLYFSGVFREEVGLSPKTYIQKLRTREE